jgi:hypothetical protein
MEPLTVCRTFTKVTDGQLSFSAGVIVEATTAEKMPKVKLEHENPLLKQLTIVK